MRSLPKESQSRRAPLAPAPLQPSGGVQGVMELNPSATAWMIWFGVVVLLVFFIKDD